MPPETTAHPMELTDHTCRLCLANDQDISPMVDALSQDELKNVIEGLLKIELSNCGPFQSACSNCVVKIRLIENIRNEFVGSNKIFDVMWTQYKRIHYPEPIPTPRMGLSKLERLDPPPRAHKITAAYINDGKVIENTEIEYVQVEGAAVFIKSENQDSIIKQEGDQYLYEELPKDEQNRMLEENLTEEAKEDDVRKAPEDDKDKTLQDVTASVEEDAGCYDKTIPCCYICSARFENFGDVSCHLVDAHADMLPFYCDKCLGYFDTLEEVNKHYVSHVYEFVCLYCPRRYRSEQDLANHNLLCKSLKCSMCEETFEFQNHLTIHQRQAHGVKSWNTGRKVKVCKSCGKSFTNAYNFARHLKSKRCSKDNTGEVIVHRSRIKPDPDAPISEGVKDEQGFKSRPALTCQICSRKLSNNSELARHIEREHEDLNMPLFSCNICPKKFTTFEKCNRHRAFHKTSKKQQKRINKKDSNDNICKICSKRFRLDNMLLKHLSDVHQLTLELFQCDQCDRKFSTETKLVRHQYNTHRENKKFYVCSHCGQKFGYKRALKDHEAKHLNAPAYQCEICLKTFIYKQCLDRHALVHSDKKNFECDFCHKQFKRNTTLAIHRRIHTGEKPCQCVLCGQRFIDSSTLIKHKQRMHPKVE